MEPLHPTEPTPLPQNEIEFEESVDLCFMLDCTGSMQPYIDMARNKVQEIITKIKEEYPQSQVRIGIVAYRDVQDSPRFEIFPFSTSSDQAKQFLSKLAAQGGGDAPEDVNGGFQKTLSLEWQNPVRLLVHIADAPCHGTYFHNCGDSHPNGLKDDKDWNKIFKELVEKRLDYLFIKISPVTDKMFEKFQAFAEKYGSLENELSFQQEQAPVQAPNFNPEIAIRSSGAVRNSLSLTTMSNKSLKKTAVSKPSKATAEPLRRVAEKKSVEASDEPLSHAREEESHQVKTEAFFVENVTKNIRAGVAKRKNALAQKPLAK